MRIKYASLKNLDKYQVRSKLLSSLTTIKLAADNVEQELNDKAMVYADLHKIIEAAKFIIVQAHAVAQLAAEHKVEGKKLVQAQLAKAAK